MSVTLLDLKTRIRERADQQNSGFIQDSELVTLINESCQTLYDLLIAQYGEEYYTSPIPSQITLIAGQKVYSLPADFYKVRGVDLNIGGEAITLKKFSFSERNKYNGSYAVHSGLANGVRLQYRIIKNKLVINQQDTASGYFDLWYIPRFTKLVADIDEMEDFNGWEKFVVIDAAIKCKHKGEESTTDLFKELALIRQDIKSASRERDIGSSERVGDSSSNDFDYRGW